MLQIFSIQGKYKPMVIFIVLVEKSTDALYGKHKFHRKKLKYNDNFYKTLSLPLVVHYQVAFISVILSIYRKVVYFLLSFSKKSQNDLFQMMAVICK